MKLFASDYDGTLNVEHQVRAEDVAAIRAFRKAGNRFGIATGRSIESINQELEKCAQADLMIDLDFLIGSNGAIILDDQRALIRRQTIEPKTAYALYDYLMQQETEHFGITNGYIYAHQLMQGKLDPGFETPYELDEALIGDAAGFFIRMADRKQAYLLAKQLKQNFPNADVFPNNNIIDINPLGVSKYTGVSEIATRYGADEVFVIGDAFNDLPMIEGFGGYAMAWAEEDIQKVATKTFTSVHAAIQEATNDPADRQ